MYDICFSWKGDQAEITKCPLETLNADHSRLWAQMTKDESEEPF